MTPLLQNGLTKEESNGLVEGHITRLKLLNGMYSETLPGWWCYNKMGNLEHAARGWLQLYFPQKIVVHAASGGCLAGSRTDGDAPEKEGTV